MTVESKNPQKIAHRSIRKVDAVVTGMILWGIVASIYGLSKDGHHNGEIPASKISEIREGKVPLSEIIKMLVFGIPKEKPTLTSRILSIFRKR